MTTILRLHSAPGIFAPGFFRWIEEGMIPFAQHKASARKLLKAFGIPREFIAPIMAGKFTKAIEGETLILTIEGGK